MNTMTEIAIGMFCVLAMLGGIATLAKAETPEPKESKSVTVAQMKGDCLRSGGILEFVYGQWQCVEWKKPDPASVKEAK